MKIKSKGDFFVHFYLKWLTRSTIVSPQVFGASSPWVLLALADDKGEFSGKPKRLTDRMRLTPDLADSAGFELLNEMALNPPSELEHLYLVRPARAALNDKVKLKLSNEVIAQLKASHERLVY